MERELAAGDVAAYVVEPIQGKGVFVAPDGYLRAAAELCHRHGALLAIDEVQTGLGRTGTFFAFEQWDVEPDLVTVAKALSGGYVPVGAVIAKSDVVERVFDKMDRAVVHSSTFGQNVLAMTAGLATLHTLDAESIVEHASTIGAHLMSGLEGVAKRHELVHEVRGRGLMIGIEFSRPRSMRLRAQWTLLESMRTGLFTQMVIVPLFRDHGILTQVAGDHQNVLKILPPLITTEAQADEFVDAIDARARRARTLGRAAVGRRQFARAPGAPCRSLTRVGTAPRPVDRRLGRARPRRRGTDTRLATRARAAGRRTGRRACGPCRGPSSTDHWRRSRVPATSSLARRRPRREARSARSSARPARARPCCAGGSKPPSSTCATCAASSS